MATSHTAPKAVEEVIEPEPEPEPETSSKARKGESITTDNLGRVVQGGRDYLGRDVSDQT